MRTTAPPVLLALLLTAVPLGAGHAVAQEGGSPGLEEATVFPVVGTMENGSAAGIDRYVAVAGDPDRDRATIAVTGREDALLYRNRTFETYGFGTLNRYVDAAWRPDGLVTLAGVSPARGLSGLWRFSPADVRRLLSTNASIRAVDVGPRGRTLVVGSAPDRDAGLLLVVGADATERARLATDAPLLAVDWRPSGDGAVVGGLDGGLLLYRNGTLTSVDGVGNASVAAVDWHPGGERLIAVGAAGRNGSRPAGRGVVLTGDADGVTAVADVDAPIHDVAWRPDGSYALAVGGRAASPQLHAVRPDGSLRSRGLDGLAGDVDWYGEDDALLAGGGRIWRYSHGTTPGELPPTASVTVTPLRPAPGEPFRISAFGSTANGSVDDVETYRYAVGTNLTDWRESASVPARFERAGRYTVGVRVRAGDGSLSPWRNTTVVVGDRRSGGGPGSPGETDDGTGGAGGDGAWPVWLMMGLTGAALLVLVAASALRRR